MERFLFELQEKLRVGLQEGLTYKHEGEVFNVIRDTEGRMVLLGPEGQAGFIRPDGSAEITGPGAPEKVVTKRARRYIPKVTGWNVVYDEVGADGRVTGRTSGIFFPKDIGYERVKRFANAVGHLNPRIREARGKSQYREAGKAPGQ